jgi:hypothetical protein
MYTHHTDQNCSTSITIELLCFMLALRKRQNGFVSYENSKTTVEELLRYHGGELFKPMSLSNSLFHFSPIFSLWDIPIYYFSEIQEENRRDIGAYMRNICSEHQVIMVPAAAASSSFLRHISQLHSSKLMTEIEQHGFKKFTTNQKEICL